MIHANATQRAVLAAILLAACDASGPPGSGVDVGAEESLGAPEDAPTARGEDERLANDDGGDAPEPDVRGRSERGVSAGTNGGAVTAPSTGGASGEPAAEASPPDEARGALQGAVSSTFAAGSAKAALDAGAKVRLSVLSDTGLLELLASADVARDGTFTLALPIARGVRVGIAELVDVRGEVVGELIVSVSAGKRGDVLQLAPISVESTLEAKVLRKVARCPGAAGKKPTALALALDVSALIDASLSDALANASKSGVDLELVTRALAGAVQAAAEARAAVLLDLGVSLDADALREGQLEALRELQQGLRDALHGTAKVADVNAKLALDLDAVLARAGELAPDLRVRAQVAADLAFSSSLATSFSVDAKLNASLAAALHACATLEAELVAEAIVALLKAAGATAGEIDAAIEAGSALKADVAKVVDLRALRDVRADLVARLTGKGKAEGGLLGSTLGLVGGLRDGLADALPALSLDLDAQLALDLNALANLNACAGAGVTAGLEVSLSALAGTLAEFAADVRAHTPGDVRAEVLATAQLFARASI